MAHPNELDALYAFLVAAAVTALLTPLAMRFARAVGAIDEPREAGANLASALFGSGLRKSHRSNLWVREGHPRHHPKVHALGRSLHRIARGNLAHL